MKMAVVQHRSPLDRCLQVRTERIHQQVLTNRKRHLYIEPIDEHIGWLTIETEVIATTTQHRSNGRLTSRNRTNSATANHGRVSKACFRDLVKPIYLKDVATIVADFEAGVPLHSIRYSEWVEPHLTKRPAAVLLCSAHNSVFASSHKNCTLTDRVIKSVTSLLGL